MPVLRGLRGGAGAMVGPPKIPKSAKKCTRVPFLCAGWPIFREHSTWTTSPWFVDGQVGGHISTHRVPQTACVLTRREAETRARGACSRGGETPAIAPPKKCSNEQRRLRWLGYDHLSLSDLLLKPGPPSPRACTIQVVPRPEPVEAGLACGAPQPAGAGRQPGSGAAFCRSAALQVSERVRVRSRYGQMTEVND